MKWVKEIKAVGFNNWFWFVFGLQRNEFHHSLDMPFTTDLIKRNQVLSKRAIAHEIDNILSDLEKK